MSNYANLKSAIQSVIKTNGNNEITGQLLQNELLAMITTLGYGYQFMGVASPDTIPGTPDAKVFYIAYTPGTYTNFGGISVTGLCVLKYATSWVKEDIPVSGGGGTEFTVEPTDLTLVSGTPNKLKFADRPYNLTTPDGLGFKILRKDNTINSQIVDTNTIYEIRYDFTLDSDLTIPAGCVLRFNGGSISGAYTLTGNNTKIEAAPTKIFGTNILIAGTWNVLFALPVWFGAIGDGATDDTNAIKNCFLLKCPVSLRGNYVISQSVRAYNSISGNGSSLIYNADCFLYYESAADLTIDGININGQSLSQFGIRFNNVQNVVMCNCTVENIGNSSIAQVSAINFMISTSCKNAYIYNCRIKNVVYDSVGACSGIGFSNNSDDTTTNNHGLRVENCRFEGFNTSREDSDCIKILSDNGLDTNVVISGCFFTGIGKRAIKTQARGVKCIGNTYEVTTTVQAVIAFQRGYGESINDTLIVNPANDETNEYFLANVFELGYGNVGIYGFNTIVKNYVPNVNGSHMFFAYLGGFGEASFENMKISNCTIGHVGFFLRFTATTPTSNIEVSNVVFNNPASFHNRFTNTTPVTLTYSKFENVGALTSYVPLSNLDFSKISNCSFVFDSKFVGFGGTSNTSDNGNRIVISYDPANSNVERVEYSGGQMRRVFASVDTNPSGLTSSRWGVLRDGAANIGTIIYKKTPSLSADNLKMEMGYILTTQSGSAVGTAVVYQIPLP